MTGISQVGHHEVDVPVVCVITRFGLRSARHLLPTYLDYRRVASSAREVETPGLLRSAFLVEDPTTCYSLSIWEHEGRIAEFGANVHAHVDAGRRIFSRLSFDRDRGPELWSTRWRLDSVSHNLAWPDLPPEALVGSSARASR